MKSPPPTPTMLLLRGEGPAARDDDAAADRDAADELEPRERLGEQDQRDHRSEERLQVGEHRRARRPDAVDRAEPEDVRHDERADNGEDEARPEQSARRPVLRREL